MISETLKKIIRSLEEKGNMAFLAGATEEQVATFEKGCGMRFPAQFREWLQFSDGGRIEEDESYPDFFAFLRDLENLLGLED